MLHVGSDNIFLVGLESEPGLERLRDVLEEVLKNVDRLLDGVDRLLEAVDRLLEGVDRMVEWEWSEILSSRSLMSFTSSFVDTCIVFMIHGYTSLYDFV